MKLKDYDGHYQQIALGAVSDLGKARAKMVESIMSAVECENHKSLNVVADAAIEGILCALAQQAAIDTTRHTQHPFFEHEGNTYFIAGERGGERKCFLKGDTTNRPRYFRIPGMEETNGLRYVSYPFVNPH